MVKNRLDAPCQSGVSLPGHFLSTQPRQVDFAAEFEQLKMTYEEKLDLFPTQFSTAILSGMGGNVVKCDEEVYVIGFMNYLTGLALDQKLISWEKGFMPLNSKKYANLLMDFVESNSI